MELLQGAKILLIQSGSEAASRLIDPLENAGPEVVVVGDLADGLRRADRETDVIILAIEDIAGGAENCRALRTDPHTREIPVLALSETPLDEPDLGTILAAGAMDVLTPPFSTALVLARVGNLVRIHQEEVYLKETEKRYRRIFDSSHYGYFLSTREGRFVEVNDALLHMLGYRSRDEVLKLKLPDDLYVNPEDRELLQKIIEKKGFVKDFRVDFKRRDGSVITILLTANLYRSPDGRTIGYEGLNIPLTDVDLSTRLWHRLTVPFRKLFKRGDNFLSVSRISELVAGQYEKVEELSEGFYTSVWKGRDVLGFEESPLVIKISRSEAINDRLMLEAQVLRKLAGHPGVPELVDVARHKDRNVIVTRFIEGKPLLELLPVDDAVSRDRIAWQLMDVTAHLHAHDVVHRDIKPSNMVVRPDGGLVLLDYGIVKTMSEAETSSTIIGTRPYMSPEQINGKSERRSDVWALGVVLYQIYTGHLPFSGNTEMELMENILGTEPAVPRSLNPRLRAQMESILIQALRKKPEGRFNDAGHMRDEVVRRVPGFRENVEDLIESRGQALSRDDK